MHTFHCPPHLRQAGESDQRLQEKLAAEAAAFAALDPEAAATQMPKMQVGFECAAVKLHTDPHAKLWVWQHIQTPQRVFQPACPSARLLYYILHPLHRPPC